MSNKSASASAASGEKWLDMKFHAFNLPNLDGGSVIDGKQPDSYLNIYVGNDKGEELVYFGGKNKWKNQDQKNPIYAGIEFTQAEFLKRAGLTSEELNDDTPIRINVMDANTFFKDSEEIGRVTTSFGGLKKAALEYMQDKSKQGGCLPIVLTEEAKEHILTKGEKRISNPRLQVTGFQARRQCPPQERKCRPRSCSVSSCSSDSDSSSCWSECSSSGVRKQIFCETRTIGQLYSERISCLKVKELKIMKKLRVIKSMLKVQYRQRYEFFQELRGFTQCQVKQLEEYGCCTSSDDSSSSDEDCEPQCKPKCKPKRKPKCNRKRKPKCNRKRRDGCPVYC